MGDVVDLNGDVCRVPVEDVCENAKDLEYVFIIGIDKNGAWDCRSSDSDAGKALIGLEMAKEFILDEVL